MIHYITKIGNTIERHTTLDFLLSDCIWVDLVNPTEEEKQLIEKEFQVELFTEQEVEEIESSSKFIELDTEIGINLNFLSLNDGRYIKEPVSFILKENRLITQREAEYKTFKDTFKKLRISKPNTGSDVFEILLETRIDYDADLIETITDKITTISKGLVKDNTLERELLVSITNLQESTIAIRENILEKQRILSSILKSKFYSKENYETLRIMIKDVGSLLEHTSFNFERLEFLQNTFLGLVDMEQNRIIKIFTVVTVIFMPPTLIASMYGMNFTFMPELDEKWGYPYALILMVVSSAATLLFFKRKKWL